MIHVAPIPECADLMHLVGISPELLTRTVNERHRGLVNDSLNRVLAVHWLNSENAVFVDSIVTKYTEEPTELDENRIKIWQVAPQLAIRLSNELPAGLLSPESPISELLPIVAESFGSKVSCHPDEDAAWVYEGPWDGKTVAILDTSGPAIYVACSPKPDLKNCELAWSFDREKYLAWFTENLAPSVQASMPMRSPLDFIKAQKTLLETLFPNRWFVNAKGKNLKHPAYIRWQRCEDLLARNGRIQLPADNKILDTVMVALCDNLSLIQSTRGSVDAQKLGDLANYGDKAVQERLRAVIQVPDQFFDILVEVACAGYHVSRGHEVKVTENEGMPDIELEIPGWTLPIQAECKCVKYSGFKNSIEKANKQIKKASQPCYGLVYLDISQRSADRASFWSDSLPNEFAQIQMEVQHCLREFNTSVSGVVLLWKDQIVLKMNDGGALCFHRYRSVLIRHRKPKQPLPEDTDVPRHGFSWERGMFSGALFRGNWRVNYGVI
jgi:hypothetical protein